MPKKQSKEVTKCGGPQFYNEKDDKYIVFLKKLGRQIVIPGEMHRAMLQAYCGEDKRDVQEICAAHGFPEEYFNEYKNIFKWTRDGLPVSDEEIEAEEPKILAARLLEKKKFDIRQEFQKQSWRDTEKDAKLWQDFVANKVSPFKDILDSWKPPKLKQYNAPTVRRKKGSKSYVMTISDWHIGAELKSLDSFRGQRWNKETFLCFFEKFMERNLERIRKEKQDLHEICILSLGDIMDGLRGETEKGTSLEQEFSREQQFNFALNILLELISRLEIFNLPIRIVSLKGNHDSLDNYILFSAIEKYYNESKGISFFNCSERSAFVEFKKTLMLIDHGAHDIMNAKIPTQKTPREAYILSLFLSRPDLLNKYPHRYFIQGDLHHNEHIEFNDFEFIMVGSPARSLYSDANNWHSRASQSSFLVGEEGIEEIFRFYFDECFK